MERLPHLELERAASQPNPQWLVLAAGEYPVQPDLCVDGALIEDRIGPGVA